MIVFVQRVLSDYRLPFFDRCGRGAGGAHVVHHVNRHLNKVRPPQATSVPETVFGNWLPAFLEKQGVFFNPRIAFESHLRSARLVVLEGESNFVNNLLLIPLLLWRGQPYTWFSLGRPTTRGVSWRRLLLWPVIRWMIDRADSVACYSSAGRDYYLAQGIAASKIVVLGNALEASAVRGDEPVRQQAAEQLVEARGWQDHLRLAYVGAMAADKRPHLLLDVAAEFRRRSDRPLALLFVGSGPQLASCQLRARELQLDCLFVGRQELAEAGTFVLASDVVVLPGLGGLAINHAMMLGRPVICGRADGTELDLVLDGQTGYYLDPLTFESLTDCLLQLAGQRELLAQLGNNARRHVDQFATVEAMTERLLTHTGLTDAARETREKPAPGRLTPAATKRGNRRVA